MSVSSLYLAALRKAIEFPTDGFVGMVDQVLALCRQHRLQLDWRDNRCRVRSLGSDDDDVIDVPLRKSAFRAMLARIATLCDEQAPGTFAPYGGVGALSLPSDPNGVLGVAWMNTPDQQWLVIVPAAAPFDRDLLPLIASRAPYQIWLKAGCPHGDDKEHWMQAEAELKTALKKSKMSPLERDVPLEAGSENVASPFTAPPELNAAIKSK